MSKKQFAAKTLMQFGGVPALDAYWGRKRLTVLAYHRILEYERPDFADAVPVVSATPAMFERQLTFIRDHFNVISLDDLRAAMMNGAALPDKPLLITFDDGYLDNYENAVPMLKRFGFPAVIFLATSRMTERGPLWWDQLARYFHHTTHTSADLPLIGQRDLSAKQHVLDELSAAMKTIPEAEKLAAVEQTRQALNASDPDDAPLFMDWEQVREVLADGIATQPHTVNHPIMTRIDAETQRAEITGSRDAIVEQTGQAVFAFAYPNGGAADYSPVTMQALYDAGIEMAFTLAPGPMRWPDVKRHPLQIRRVYLGYQDTYEVFVAKVMGLPALNHPLAFPDATH